MSCDSNWAHVTKAIYRQVNFSSHPPDQRNRDMMGPTVHTVGLSPYLEIKVMNGTSLWLSCFLGLGFEGLIGWKPPADVLRLHRLSSHRGRAKSIDHASGPGVVHQNGPVGCIDQWVGDWGVVTETFHTGRFCSPSEGKVQYRLWAVNDFTFTCIFFVVVLLHVICNSSLPKHKYC